MVERLVDCLVLRLEMSLLRGGRSRYSDETRLERQAGREGRGCSLVWLLGRAESEPRGGQIDTGVCVDIGESWGLLSQEWVCINAGKTTV